METVNNLASAASRAIWGDKDAANGAEPQSVKADETTQHTQEPISGQVGDVKAGEPYDKGNDESAAAIPSTDSEPTHSTLPVDSHPKPISSSTSTETPNIPSGEHQSTGDPSSAPQDTQKHQGADRPTETPSSDEHERIKATKAEAEEAAKVDVSGPGPKSLSDKAAGNTAGSVDSTPGLQKESQGEGTGEKYVKSSGTKAEGGDFDASAPGAGKEADRELLAILAGGKNSVGKDTETQGLTGYQGLLEEKGIHHGVEKETSRVDKEASPSPEEKVGKTKLSDKIKAKLHIHGKDKE